LLQRKGRQEEIGWQSQHLESLDWRNLQEMVENYRQGESSLTVKYDFLSKEMPLTYFRDFGWRVASEWSKLWFCFSPSQEMAA